MLLIRHLETENLSLEGMGPDNTILNAWTKGEGDILGTAAAYIIFNPKGGKKKSFLLKIL